MYSSVFREWKVAALFVGGISLFVAAYFAEGGGYEQLEFGRRDAPKAAPVAVAAPVPRAPAPTAVQFTSDEELAAAFAEPSEAAPAPSVSPDVAQSAADGAVAAADAGVAPGAAPSTPAEQAP